VEYGKSRLESLGIKMDSLFNGTYKNKKVLITGHTGFKGSWLTLWLKELGAEVLGYALEPPTNPSLFDSLGLKDNIVHVIGDIRDDAKLLSVCQDFQPEFVFHLAAQPLVRLSYKEPRLTYETNVMGTINLYEAIRKTDSVRVVINITSDKCYENREWVYGYRETDPMGGYDPYSSSKGCAELVTSAYRNSYFNPQHYGKTHNVALASVRAGNVIGGGDWGEDRLVPDCFRSLLSGRKILIRNPEAIRPWQHVLEPLSGYLLLARKLSDDGLPYVGSWNFGPFDEDAKPVEWLVRSICEKWGDSADYEVAQGNHPHEAHYLKLDCSKAIAVLGWSPCWSLETAIDKIMEWYEAYGAGEKTESLENICSRQIKEYSDLRSKR